MLSKRLKNISNTRIIALSFLIIILTGTIVLCLPVSSKAGNWTAPLDALFTSVSAACVTGLTVYDTYTHWSLFGQAVILVMIQTGGIGLMTIIGIFSIFIKKRINPHEVRLLMQSAGNMRRNGMLQLIKNILKSTLFFEAVGAVLLAVRFCPQFGILNGIYYAVFHSISAFCNAGFDLMGKSGEFSSFTAYIDDPLVSFTLMFLIISGGIGFLVWDDIIRNKLHFGMYSLHTKIVLIASAVLIIAGTAGFLIFEADGVLSDLKLPDKIMAAMFLSVDMRTAGFSTIDFSMLSDASSLLAMSLIIIGGGSGSTAGGIKVTTFAVVLFATISMARGRNEVVVWKRRIDGHSVSQASIITIVYICGIILAAMLICAADSIAMGDALFEAVSAAGTNGITKGITPALSAFSKIIIIFLMYAGRIGGLSLLLVFGEKKPEPPLKRPEAKVLIG